MTIAERLSQLNEEELRIARIFFALGYTSTSVNSNFETYTQQYGESGSRGQLLADLEPLLSDTIVRMTHPRTGLEGKWEDVDLFQNLRSRIVSETDPSVPREGDHARDPDPEPDEVVEALVAEYNIVMHAVQSGIAAISQFDRTFLQSKHLRVGVDSAHISQAALAGILIEKGIITRREYFQSLVKQAYLEKKSSESTLSQLTGRPVNLG